MSEATGFPLKRSVDARWDLWTAGVHCSTLRKYRAMGAIRNQTEYQRVGAANRAVFSAFAHQIN